MTTHYQISEDATFPRTEGVNEILQVVSDYNAALKAASLTDIMAVYMEDAALIPEVQPPIIGVKNIRAVYDELVKLIKFNDDSIINVVDAFASGDSGYVRSHRTPGSVTEVETGETKHPYWRELWVFKRDTDNKMKFAIYAYGSAPEGEFNPVEAVLW